MAKNKIPYLRKRPGAGGTIRYYWIPSEALVRAGHEVHRLSDNLAEAQEEARQRNVALNEPSPAVEPAKRREPRSLAAAIASYRVNPAYTDIGLSTRNFYRWHFATLEEWAGDEPVASITPVDVQDLYISIRDGDRRSVEEILAEYKLADTPKYRRRAEARRQSHPTKAQNTIKTLQQVLKHAVFLGWITANPSEDPGIKKPERQKEPILWTDATVEAFMAAADSVGRYSIGTAVLVNYWMGQREADILKLPVAMVTARVADIRQNKYGARVRIRIRKVPHVRQRIDEELARRPEGVKSNVFIISERTGRPYTRFNFAEWVGKIAAAAAAEAECRGDDELASQIVGAEFRWLRHSAVTTLARVGATLPQIAEVTGHSLKSIHDILQVYLINTGDLAEAAFDLRMAAEGIVEIDEAGAL